ncbi:MAG: 50S ribosomal protein L11 methyltransferase [Pseudomonadota bacterium]
MYSAKLKLPAILDEKSVQAFSGDFMLESQAHIALRENNEKDGDWCLEWITDQRFTPQDLIARGALMLAQHDMDCEISDIQIEEIPEKDWLKESYKQFPPFSVGPFFIYGSHYDAHAENKVPEGQMGLQIDAATAFGSGEHGTTKGCLQAMLDLKGQGVCPWNVLDIGCGSGILSIAAWKLWKTPILAVDIEDEAVRVTGHHCELNKVPQSAGNVTAMQSDGFQAGDISKKGPFELILANLLIGPLKSMAGDIFKALDQNSYVVLSGVLDEQKDEILNAYTSAYALTLKKDYSIDGWTTLILHKA